jgi:acyl transferase domain-containing protein/acyl carrier protein/short-subunit dehydrogenase/ubiquinone/menaquinone biosynthesis C-methylase UbiE
MSDPFHLLDHYAEALLAGFAARAGRPIDVRLARHRRLADVLAHAVAALDPALLNGDSGGEARRRRAALLTEALALTPHVELLDHCVSALGDVLSGARAGTDILFPGGAMDLVARIYDGTAWADHFNRMAAEAVARMTEALLADGVTHVRILEIGAGTGGTSRHVLRALDRFAGSVTYDYTDVSPGFVAHGRARFGQSHGFARFRVLDIEHPPVAQGFEAGAYHAVVATNVLHATRRIDQALGHASLLLEPGGILVLNEVTRASLFGTLTFGLLDGWWRFEDAEARLPGAPLLDRTRWAAALASSGFAPPACFGWQGATDSFQTLFVGEWTDVAVDVEPPLPLASSVPAAVTGSLGQIAVVVARVLGLDVAEIDPDRPLAELGVDSIVAAQIATALADSLGVGLAASEIYDHATVAGLERHLAGLLPAAPPVDDLVLQRRSVDPAPMKMSSRGAERRGDLQDGAHRAGDRHVADAPRDDSPAVREPVCFVGDEPAGIQAPAGNATDIAVIGIACRFPGAADREAFWRNLVGGVCSITEVPAERWDWRPHFAASRGDGHIVSRWGGFLDGHDLFDPEPFRITHGEARAMSPQQRLFLETSWHALEDAGYGRAELAGTKCGVFVGVAPDGWGGGRADARSSLGDSNAILSARLAYALDLKGSCLPIDTACSSSLVAVHLAARSLIDGDNAMALAGGVSVLMGGPRLHAFLSDSGMASPNGLCRTFDAGADGFVPGEGVGVVTLKRLDRARADGDHIYAVIKASGVNQDGTTSGITAPSGPAQTALEREVYGRGGIDARSIGMVEAHGTGTKLGDPIEVNALARAFRVDTDETGFCRIGSVKSNIGHTLTAAGIAGFIKAALAVGRGVVPPSLHYTAANPEIDFASSPFRVVTAAEPWEGHAGLPRRAAVSSFGFSGTNAHIVLQAPPPRPAPVANPGPRLIAVSAKTEEALNRRLVDLARAAAEADGPFPWFAWTATAGRTHFEHRATIIAGNFKELRDFCGDLAEFQVSEMARRTVVSARQDAAGLQLVPATLADAAEAFLEGKRVDLTAVFDRGDRMRVPLPVYPFERLRFAPPEPVVQGPEPAERHRLIAGNESNLDGLRFRLAGTDRWPGLADHRYQGRAIWPAAAIIEAMWSVGRLALGERFELGDLSFSQPLAVGDTGWLIVGRDDDGAVILRLVGDGDCPHARARLVPCDAVPMRRVDMAMAEGRRIDSAAAYEALAAVGFDYGPAFHGITGMTVHGDRVLAELAAGDCRGFDWPPSATDGAIQAAVGLALADASGGRMTVVPGGVARVRLHGSLDGATRVLVERRLAESDRVRLDINLLDPEGVVLAELIGLEAAIRDTAAPAAITTGDAVVAYEPYWRPDTGGAPAAVAGFALLLPAGLALDGAEALQIIRPAADAAGWRACFAALAASGTVPDRIADLRSLLGAPSSAGDAAAAEAAVQSMAALVSGWLLALPGRPLRLVRAYRHDGQTVPAEACLDGLARTLAHEAPEVSLSLLGLDATAVPLVALGTEFARSGAQHALVRRGTRMIRAWRQVTVAPQAVKLPSRPVVIVTGAYGGIGSATAQHLAETCQARLVLVSRRPTPAAGSDLARTVTGFGGEAVEICADVGSSAGARGVVQAALSVYGRIDAVIHAAGVTRDGLLRGRAPADVAAVLAPKLAGTTALLDALTGQSIQAFVCFGSLAAVFGNTGQADYAAANAFMGALAERDGLPLVTVDWPFWRDGGLTARDGDDAKLRAATGTRWIETAEGLAMLDLALAGGRPHLAVAAGDPERIARLFAGERPAVEVTGGASADDALAYLRRLLNEVTGAPPGRLRAEREIEDLALDSMHVMQLNDRLEQDFGTVSKTLFYECRTVGDVAARLGLQTPRHKSVVSIPKPRAVEETVRRPGTVEPIAIVGIAGRFPGADDLDDFWANLAAGRDCVTEIPENRWDHGLVFDPAPGRPGKAYSRWGGFLSQVDGFDPLFFGISPADAERMDPQERLTLETAWEAMEHAGLTRTTLCSGPDRLGAVYIGVMYGDYQMLGAEQHALGNPVAASAPYWSIANRLSYVLDLHGPSLAVDSACSSSLTALHLACRSLWSGEAEVALAGGVNLSLHPLKYVGLSQGRFASTDGRCRSFAAGGDGYVPGEGVAIAILKPLAAALAAGDPIHGVIRGSAVNHGGRTNGYTVPSPASQAGAIRAALASAGMTAADIDYVEAHGTGTTLGDPIEVAGLAAAFAATQSDAVCPIGTVKSSIGHLEAAAGMAGLAKVLLQFRHTTLAPTLLHGASNPGIDFAAARLRLVTAAEPWRPRRADTTLTAGISSFGAGGANAHLIVEAPPPVAATMPAGGPFGFVVSARTLEQLQAYADRLCRYFGQTGAQIADVARTLQLGREAMPVRLGFVASSLAEAAERLTRWRSGEAGAVDLHVPADEDAPVPGWDANAGLEASVSAWVRGAPVAWGVLDLAGRRTVVPPRPFMRRRYWPKTVGASAPARGVAEMTLDPSMPVVDHHRVGGKALVPAALLLALTREVAGGALSDVVLHRPGEVADGQLVLRTLRDGAALRVETGDGAVLLTAQAADAEPILPIKAPGGGGTLSPADAYRRFVALGIDYGPSFRRLGPLAADGEVAEAEIRPADREIAVTGLDAAMQAIIALVPDAVGIAGVPRRIDRVSWHGDPSGLVRTRVRAATADCFDVDGLDAAGGLLVALRGLHVRRMAFVAAGPAPNTLVPVWREAAGGTPAATPRHLMIVHGPGTGALADALAGAVEHATRLDLLSRDDEALRQALQAAAIPVDAVAVLCGAGESAEGLALGFLDVARALSRCPAARRPSKLIVVTSGLHDVTGSDGIDPVGAALPGMARSLAAELPGLAVVLADIERAGTAANTARRILAEAAMDPIRDVAWRDGRRFERRLVRGTIEATRGGLPREPVCLVTGGSGGLGQALAGHLVARFGARVVLNGRRPSLGGTLPASVAYLAADLCDAVAVEQLAGRVVAEYGRLDAIFHLPLVLADRRLAHMPDDVFLAAFAPKAAGTAHVLAAAHRHGARVMVFSSANVFAGADGQANYVAGSAVQDALALAAGPDVQVINWGLWSEIGAVADSATQARLAEAGIRPIRPAEGFAALDRVLASAERQVAVVKATPAALVRLGLRDDTPNGLEAATDAFDRLESYGRARLLANLAAASGDTRRVFTTGGLARRLGVVARHHRLFDALLAMLGRHGLADMRDGVIRLPASGVDPAAQLAGATAALDTTLNQLPWLAKPRALLDAVLDRYRALLDGTADPLSVLFPGGSTALIEGAYRGNPLSDAYNAAAAAAVTAHRRASGPGWRAIEVGAGTGGTTGAILAGLDRGVVPGAYLYTDLSWRFLEHGQTIFGVGRPWFATALYDVEQSVEANGQQAGTFDTVIAANVLHATADLGRVLTELRRLLRPDGLLVVTELIAAQDYGTLVFGLTEGWWKSADASRIAHSPVIDAAGWERRLAQAGFTGTECVDLAASGGRGQAVFLATAPVTPNAVAMAPAPPARKAAAVAAPPLVADDRLRQALLAHLRGVFADVLKLDPAEMRAADPFEQYGLESLTSMQIRDRLNSNFGALSQTLLFEHDTLASLAGHLIATREEAVRDVLGIAAEPSELPAATRAPAEIGGRAPTPADQPIAIIGMAGRFPGADGLDTFWRLLEEGRSAIGPLPADRWPQDGRTYTKWGGFLDAIDRFDPLFFGIAPADAAAIDPQERLFLETAWHAMEHAGYTPARLNAGGPVGVYVGVMNAGYQWLAAQHDAAVATPATSAYWSIANRLSFVADFAGPSLAVDTACSSSLTALHLAVQALRAGECGAAVVGGVNLIVHPRQMANLCEARMLSAGSENRAFAAGADGFVDGEGVAAIVLKPLDAAIASGDRIAAVIRATAINSGGKTAGFSVPNPVAQAGVITDALRAAGVAPNTIGFVEAHGTGTALGDPIEIAGIAAAFGGGARPVPLVLGALKANVGHLESAAGIAGLVKTVLQLGHARIAPLRHAEHPNPLIDFAAAGCLGPAQAMTWPALVGSEGTHLPRRAGVSSFGAGGANAHVILEEAPVRKPVAATVPLRDVLALSAADEPALRRLAASLRPIVAAADAAARADIFHTLRVGRRAFSLRAAAVIDGAAAAVRILDAIAAGHAVPGLINGRGTGPSARHIEETAEGRRIVEAMLVAGDAEGLAGLWADGVTVDWSRLPWAADRQVVALPGYPFARERYWLEGAAPPVRVEPALGHVTRLIRGAWLPAPPLAAEDDASGPWALIGSARVVAAIEARQGPPALHFVPGAGFDPADPAAWTTLADGVAAKGRPLDLLIAPDALGVGPAAAAQTMFLALWAMAHRPGRIARLLVATEGSAATVGGLAALARSAIEEGFKVRIVVVPPDLDPLALGAILSEEAVSGDDEPVVDRQDGRQIWVRHWLETEDAAVPLFRAGGRYLIAGGLGEVGRALAAHLVSAYGATVGILGRTAPGEATRRGLDAIAGSSGSVHYAAANLTDRAAIERAVTELKRAMGGIDGVLDLARLVDNAPIARKDPTTFACVVAVKAAGTALLDAALANERLDFFVVFSSLAAWYGLAGGADYAAACAIQEGLMVERAVRVAKGERHGRSLAIAWPQWRHDRELDAERRRRMEADGLGMIDVAAGVAIMERTAASGEVVVAAVVGTPDALALLAEAPLDGLTDDELAAYAATLRVVAGDDDPEMTQTATIDIVRHAFAEQLRVDPARIGGDVAFTDLGLDSIKALHVAERLSRDLGIDVEPALFIDHAMAGGLAAALDERRAASMRNAGE